MINIKMQPTDVQKLSPKITVIGVGGAGGNAVNNMVSSGLNGCEFLVCNTDAQALEGSLSENRIQLGPNVTGGLGAGSKPDVGKAAAEETLGEVMQYLEGANMVFVTAGMGGGTGTGAAPIIAKACREKGILTVGVVTKPFHFEGSHRMRSAEAGIKEMQDYVDTLIVIPNQNLFRVANERTTFAEAFQMADSVLQAGVRGVTDLMVRPGLVNLDFADIRTAMLEMGKAMMGTGEAEGEKRAIEAAESAINNPLLDDISMKGAHGVIINVSGGFDMTLFEADEACNRIRDEVDPDANIIFGATFDESLEGKMRVSIVATGIDKEAEQKRVSGGAATKTEASGRRALERANPNTESHAERSRPEPRRTSTPSFVPASQITREISAPSVQEGEIEVYEQHELAMSEGAKNTAMRGTRYKDAFIPPKPVEAGVNRASAGPSPYAFHGSPGGYGSLPLNMPAPPPSAPSHTAAAPGLRLNPPTLPTGEQKRRSPSLFERITGSVQQTFESMKEEQSAPRQRVAPSPAVGSSPAQGSLNIDQPAKARKPEDELDIPAFLRRQAN